MVRQLKNMARSSWHDFTEAYVKMMLEKYNELLVKGGEFWDLPFDPKYVHTIEQRKDGRYKAFFCALDFRNYYMHVADKYRYQELIDDNIKVEQNKILLKATNELVESAKKKCFIVTEIHEISTIIPNITWIEYMKMIVPFQESKSMYDKD